MKSVHKQVRRNVLEKAYKDTHDSVATEVMKRVRLALLEPIRGLERQTKDRLIEEIKRVLNQELD